MLSCLAPLCDCGGFPPLGGLPGWADTQDIFEVEWSTMFFSCVYIFLLGWTPLAQVGWSSGVTLVWSNRSLWLVSPCSCLCPGHADLLLHVRNPHQWDFFLVSRQRKDGFWPRRRDTRFWSRRWDTGSWDTFSPFRNCAKGDQGGCQLILPSSTSLLSLVSLSILILLRLPITLKMRTKVTQTYIRWMKLSCVSDMFQIYLYPALYWRPWIFTCFTG